MQSVSLADALDVEPDDAITLDVEPHGSAPEDATNLVAKAATAMMATVGAGRGAALRLHKRIPIAAGLGGGSADAAATLVGLNALWDAGLSRKALERLGARIGADVPFCVRGGTAAARGVGEVLSPLVVREPLWWVLASDASPLATADVYAARDELGVSDVEDPHDLADALARGDLGAIGASLRNDLEAAALAVAPGVAEVRDRLLGAGGVAVVMSGSGPTWCALARDEAHARAIAQRLEAGWVEVVRSVELGARIAAG
jgi:4-diphosphocytidyl-2-C-methyl-D-erythritol kinase